MYFLASNFSSIFLLFILSIYLTGCALVATDIKDTSLNNAQSSFIKEDFDPLKTPLGQLHSKDFKTYPQQSGAILISDGKKALLHRTALVRMASKSILLQTYIYKNDPESRLLMFELLRAANRGVEVKILIDDNGLDSDFSDIITLDSHPNIEVKIFNPYKNRNKILRLAEMIYDFKRITRRMHNKIFVVDNIALIIGGRNVANNYFDTSKGVNFIDCDAIFIGPVVLDAVKNFKAFWEFQKSIPATLLPSKLSMKNYMQNLDLNLNILNKTPQKWQQYDQIMQEFLSSYQNKNFKIHWGKAHFIGDLPQKIIEKEPHSPISEALIEISKNTQKSMNIASAYFVPGKDGLMMIKELRKRNIDVLALTNSLASMDSAVVYAAWQRYRDILLDEGVKVFEYSYHGNKKSNLREKIGSSSSFHSKIITFDEKITWIGSFNLDPRSISLNTESVVVFEDENFAKLANENILNDTKHSWRLVRKKGKTTWQGLDQNGNFTIHSFPPDTSIFLRGFNFLSKILPESQI